MLGIPWFGYALSTYFLVRRALAEMPEAQQRATNGRLCAIGGKVFPKDAPDLPAAVARVRRLALFDLGLFFVVFTCMILMRFGL